MKTEKPLKCCDKFMELKASYFSGHRYLIFQCNECGNIKDKDVGI